MTNNAGNNVLSDPEVLKRILAFGKDVLKYFPALIIPGILSVLRIGIFTRIFQADEYGQYALVLALGTVFISLLSNWLEHSIVRFLPKFREKDGLSKIINNLISIALLVVLLFVISSVLLYPLAMPLLGKYVRFYHTGVLLIITGILFAITSRFFQANLRSQEYSKYKIGLAITSFTLGLTFIFLIAKDVIWLIVATATSYTLMFSFMVKKLQLFKICRNMKKDLDFSLLKRITLYGLPMIGWFAGTKLLNLSDRFLIEIFRQSAEVGIYSANYTLASKGFQLISGPLILAANPLIFNLWEGGDQGKVSEVISSFSRYFMLILFPMVVWLSLFGKEIVFLFLGQDFREGHYIIPILLLGFLAWGFAQFGHKGLEIKRNTGLIFVLVLICLLVNVILNLIFVPRYGYIAAAITTLICYLIYPVLVFFATRSYLKWQIPWCSIIKIVGSSLLTGSLLFILKYSIFDGFLSIGKLVSFSTLALMLYFGLLYFFGEIEKYEIRYIKKGTFLLLARFIKWI